MGDYPPTPPPVVGSVGRKIEKVKEKIIDINQELDTASKGIGAARDTCRK